MNKMKLLFTLAIPVILSQNVQAQTSSRLTAESHWSNNGATFVPVDSSDFVYTSDMRGGDLKNTLKYDNSTTWVYVNDSAYQNSQYVSQEFDSATNNLTSMTMQYWNDTIWVLSTRTLYTYNSANMVTSKIQQTWNHTMWVPTSEDIYTYDAGSGLMILDQYETWNSLTSAFDPMSQKVYSYDVVSHKLLSEVDQNTAGGVLSYTGEFTYTYSSRWQLLTTTFSTWSSGWVNNNMTTNAYDTSGDMITALYQTWDPIGMAWMNVTYDIYSNFTATHKAQSQIHQTWVSTGAGMWVNNMQDTYTYNTFDQMTSSVGESWNIVGVFEFAAGDPAAMYYYNTYTHVTAVKNVTNTNGDANVYPVPASNMLHIDLKWNAAQTATIAIYDMAGRMVTPQISTPASVEYHTAMSVNNLANGMYVVRINGAEGQVVKQIVIAN